jgi:predicted Zn-dependent protease
MRHTGYYTDGRTAARQDVLVEPGRTALRLYRPEGQLLAEWPYAGLRVAEEVYGDGPVRLRHRARGEATLSLPTAALLRQVRALGGPRLTGHPWLRPTLTAAGIALVLAAALLGALMWGLPRALAPLARWVPAAWGEALGERVLAQLSSGHAVCTGAAGQAALDGLAQRLAAHAELPYRLHVHVLRDPAVNAFALPGGEIVVMDGLLHAAHDPEEVAGVLAHEIAHAVYRHPLQGLLRTAGSGLLLGALLGSHGSLDAAAGQFAARLVLFSYSRQDEAAADRLGVHLLNAADIRGKPLAELLRRLSAQGRGAGTPALLSTHPSSAERIAAIEAEAHGRGPALEPGPWRALRGICE